MQPKHFESLYPPETREYEVQTIVKYIQEGESCQVIGLPGSGRANILGLLAYNREIRLKHFPTRHNIVHFIMVNLSEVKERPYKDVLKFLHLSILESLRERQLEEEYMKVDSHFKDALNYDDELVSTQRLKNSVEYLAIERKLTLIFLFDKFDEYVHQVDTTFFLLLRSLRDIAKYRFSVIFSLNRPLEEILDREIYASFSDAVIGHTVYLSLYDRPTVEFRMSYIEKLMKKELSLSLKQEVITLTGGHLRLTKGAVEALLTQTEDSMESIEEFLLAKKTIQASLHSIWENLTPSEQNELRDNTLSDNESYLQRTGLVKEGKITIPIFRNAIDEKLFSNQESKIIYDENTQTISKGDVEISHLLTKSEYRLLRYLLLHQGEVVERETIVQTVWQDEVSTEGVTEQAIDQLLFRLRHKIEEDPSSPQHLLTVKGRGIQFVQ